MEITFRQRAGERLITRWTQPLEAEPAHGFLMRLAALHRQPSVTAFAAEMNIRIEQITPGYCLEAILASCLATEKDRQALVKWTPDVQKPYAFINGQQIRRYDFTTYTRRYCPACLAESPHHRVWFDLAFVNICPLHGTRVTDHADDGSVIGWRHAYPDETLNGTRLSIHAHRLNRIPESIESYALGRLGLLPIQNNELLDAYPLSDVVEACEYVGRLVIGGWVLTMPMIDSPGFEAEKIIVAGYTILNDRSLGLMRDLLLRIAREAPPDAFGTKNIFGWAGDRFRDGNPIAVVLRKLMKQVAIGLGKGSRFHVPQTEFIKSEYLTTTEASAILGIRRHSFISATNIAGLFQPNRGHQGSPLLVRRDQLEKIADVFNNPVTRSQAAAYLAVSAKIFSEIVLGGHISKIGIRAIPNSFEVQFSIKELDGFLARIPLIRNTNADLRPSMTIMVTPTIPTIADVLEHSGFDAGKFFTSVFESGIKVFTRTGLGNGLADFRLETSNLPLGHTLTARCLSIVTTREQNIGADQIAMREVCAILNVSPATVKALVDLGYLTCIPSKDRSQRHSISRQSVDDFASEFIAGKFYKNICDGAERPSGKQSSSPKSIFDLERKKKSLPKVHVIYNRNAARTAFGMSQDPDENDIERTSWKDINKFLRNNGSIFALFQVHENFKAMFSDSARKWPMYVRYCFNAPLPAEKMSPGLTYSIKADLIINGCRAKSVMDDFDDKLNIRRVHHAITGEVDREHGIRRASMTAVMRVAHDLGGSFQQIMWDNAEADAPVIMRMLHMLKCSFEDGPRQYDPRMLGDWPTAFRH